MEVKRVREFIYNSWSQTLRFNEKDSITLIGLPYPYTVPCIADTFQEIYYWDTYFTNEGLIGDNHFIYAKNNTDNLLHLLRKYGNVPNGNRTYYLNRSQPPFLSMMVKSIYQQSGDTDWLKEAYNTLLIEYEFWMTKRITPIGLNHFQGSNTQLSADDFISVSGRQLGTDFMKKGLSEEQLLVLTNHLIAECESGWNFTPRFEGRCRDFCPIDLNAYLYLYEMNFAFYVQELHLTDSAEYWLNKAETRKELLKRYCYNTKDHLYYDYDYINDKQSEIISSAIFSLMYANVVDVKETKHLVRSLDKLEFEYGISTCENKDYQYKYQWSYPNALPPIYFITVAGFNNYGYKKEASRIAEKYIKMITNTYNTTGNLWETYNVRKGNTDVRKDYKMSPMLGWTAGVFVYLSDYLENK